MAGLSDHDMVKCHLVLSPKVDPTQKETGLTRSLASQINFKRANQYQFDIELQKVDWDVVIDTPPPDKVSVNYVKAVCQAALAAKTPTFQNKGKKQDKHEELVDRLNDAKLKLTRQNLHPDITHTQKMENEESIKEINRTMEEAFAGKRLDEENRAISDIKVNPAVFFKYTNKHRKRKERVGPLRNGTTYESGPRKMAEILSQYQRSYSRPHL